MHALIDGAGRPLAFRLSGGNIADIVLAAALLEATAASAWLIGDKGYDADHLRAFLDSRGTIAVIPNKSNRKRRFPFDAERYAWRNVIERTNCRIKDFRAIATRYARPQLPRRLVPPQRTALLVRLSPHPSAAAAAPCAGAFDEDWITIRIVVIAR